MPRKYPMLNLGANLVCDNSGLAMRSKGGRRRPPPSLRQFRICLRPEEVCWPQNQGTCPSPLAY